MNDHLKVLPSGAIPPGEGHYGGPSDERVATPTEHDELTAAGWRGTVIKTLWFHPAHDGAFSTDEALRQLREDQA